jgi:hypothetical protein
LLFQVLKELIPAIRYIFYTKADKKECHQDIDFLKNTFTVESYIFDKKQKKEVYQTKQSH